MLDDLPCLVPLEAVLAVILSPVGMDKLQKLVHKVVTHILVCEGLLQGLNELGHVASQDVKSRHVQDHQKQHVIITNEERLVDEVAEMLSPGLGATSGNILLVPSSGVTQGLQLAFIFPCPGGGAITNCASVLGGSLGSFFSLSHKLKLFCVMCKDYMRGRHVLM